MTGADTYFAYGSNMSYHRMRQRVPAAERIGIARLDGWVLRFHKPSLDGSGKADIVPVVGGRAVVWGVLWSLGETGWEAMDAFEGDGYQRMPLLVLTADGGTHRVVAYCATDSDPSLLPYSWYREHAVRGAIEAELPPDYIMRLRSIRSAVDPDAARAAREFAIYAPDLAGA